MKSILMIGIALAMTTCAQASPSAGHAGSRSTHAIATPHSTKTATGAGAKTEHAHVHAYTKKDGTQVAAHDRSTRDHTKDNNWSTKGNVNPETGKPGTK